MLGHRAAAVERPGIYELAPLVEQIATLIGGLYLVAYSMRESLLRQFTRERRALGSAQSRNADLKP